VKKKYEVEIANHRRRTAEVKQSSNLRQMQDMEYMQALEMDRQKEQEEKKAKEVFRNICVSTFFSYVFVCICA
jgi:hypothetical protein